MTTQREVKEKLVKDEPIQWHLNTTKHDRCPSCGSSNLGWLEKGRRMCMGEGCHAVWVKT